MEKFSGRRNSNHGNLNTTTANSRMEVLAVIKNQNIGLILKRFFGVLICINPIPLQG
jgi:hypothetical protein